VAVQLVREVDGSRRELTRAIRVTQARFQLRSRAGSTQPLLQRCPHLRVLRGRPSQLRLQLLHAHRADVFVTPALFQKLEVRLPEQRGHTSRARGGANLVSGARHITIPGFQCEPWEVIIV
jgi:hypothetical protein